MIDIATEHGLIDIKKRMDSRDVHPEAVFSHKIVRADVLAEALMRIGEYVAENGMEGEGPFQAARDLLLRRRPRGVQSLTARQDETTLDVAKRVINEMGPGVLPIQGPPGAGKTYTGSRMICELVRQGKTVGITANSHKVIRNLLDGVVKASHEDGNNLQCIQKEKEVEEDSDRLTFTKSNDDLLGALGSSAQVGGATAWFWSREDAQGSVDVLIVDEAAQMSLANVLAISGAAKTLVLLGDPQQLDQPIQGSHPDGTDISALAHLLRGEETIKEDQGLFLEETLRLHPSICTFTSDLFYAGKLEAREHNARQAVHTNTPVNGAGLWYLPVDHQGNINSSIEEVRAIETLVASLLE